MLVSQDKVDSKDKMPTLAENASTQPIEAPPSYHQIRESLPTNSQDPHLLLQHQTNFPSSSSSDPSASSGGSEMRFKDAAEKLQMAIEEYKTAQENLTRNPEETQHRETIKEQEANIYRKLMDVGNSATDSRVREHYHRTAAFFMKAAPEKKGGIVNDVSRGIIMILAAPSALLVASLVAAGEIVVGTGLLIKGIGKILSGGSLRGKRH
ncbi:hypothetical protein Moror_7189 [Moniliophthora roreri MCA 2997]|uniref:Uncharacterized protein n=2 Tax=Moniliophthora roreri TaxID=221103 RepID=V2YWY2_MONRO|nr:hypothetical protein Moror_7189 [Moniliophthora roreri MCA 2997]